MKSPCVRRGVLGTSPRTQAGFKFKCLLGTSPRTQAGFKFKCLLGTSPHTSPRTQAGLKLQFLLGTSPCPKRVLNSNVYLLVHKQVSHDMTILQNAQLNLFVKF